MELAPIFIVTLFVLAFSFWIWAIVDIVKNNFKKPSVNFLWFWIVLLLPLIGSFAYFLSKNSSRKKEFNPQFNK